MTQAQEKYLAHWLTRSLPSDRIGKLVINKEYNADMLAAAMAKHEGFTYAPDSEVYWKQGKGAEKDYIFTTTQFPRSTSSPCRRSRRMTSIWTKIWR